MSYADKSKRRGRLSTKVILITIVFTVLMMLATIATVYVQYKNNIVSHYVDLGVYYARSVAAYIDGDTIAGYLETGTTDAYYDEVQEFIDIIRDNSDIELLYVYTPTEDDYFIYLWDATNDPIRFDLGHHEGYMEGGKEFSYAICSKTPDYVYMTGGKLGYSNMVITGAPIYDSAGEPVAMVCIDIQMPWINQLIARFSLVAGVSIAIIIVLMCAVILAVIRRGILQPIAKLDRASQDMVDNLESGEAFHLDIHTGDEIEDLAEAYERMYGEVQDYIGRLGRITAEKERIGAELHVARQIQANMLPQIFPPYPDRTDMDIHASMNPAKEVGGDFYDFFLIDDSHLAVVMADVSGKGVPAALFMAISKMLIKTRTQQGGTPAEILMSVNNMLCEGNEADMFVTVWLGIIDLSTGVLTAANAGHEFPAYRKAGGTFELIKSRHGLVLGGMRDIRYTDYEIPFAPGDSIYLYTDGIPEATNAADEQFGTDRMLAALNAAASASCVDTIAAVMRGIQDYVGDAPQFDDITMLCLTYNGPER